MTDNRWQIGIAGNYANEDDDRVRKAILDTQKRFGCSGSEAAKWLILQATANAHLQDAPAIQELTANAPTVLVDNSEVVAAINLLLDAVRTMRESNEVGLAYVAEKLDNITITHIQPRQELPPTMDETPTTWEEIDPNADTPFIRGARNMARPGLRLES